MPKAWDEREKQTIRISLLREGRKLFEQYGLQKTTVDEISKAARISKGAFYLFFGSKEELYFSILESVEGEYRERIFGILSRTDLPRREVFGIFLRNVIDSMKTLPIYARLFSSDYEMLVRKLPEDLMKNHAAGDFSRFAAYFEPWIRNGWMRPVNLTALSGIFASMIFWFMHRDDLGMEDPGAVEDLWIGMMSEYLVPDEEEER